MLTWHVIFRKISAETQINKKVANTDYKFMKGPYLYLLIASVQNIWDDEGDCMFDIAHYNVFQQ